MGSKQEEFLNVLEKHVEGMSLIKLVLSNRRRRDADLKSIIVSIVKLKRGYNLNFVYRHTTKDITKNYEFSDGVHLISRAIQNDFYNADAFTNTENLSLSIHPSGIASLRISAPTHKPKSSLQHDRVKERLIGAEGSTYLHELGITNEKGEIRREMNDKYRQINRYIELLSPYLLEFPPGRQVNVVDMGSGKGYLTFALYDYIVNTLKRQVVVTGVEVREELVNTCNAIAHRANFKGLTFVHGTIGGVSVSPADVIIALHACDTATDEAIHWGIRANASLIVCAPCCHKQLRTQLSVTNELKGIVQHGILAERQAEILTDALRAMIMESQGYRTRVFEFVSTEHTLKNLMLVGIRGDQGKGNAMSNLEKIASLKALWGIGKHRLEELLEQEG